MNRLKRKQHDEITIGVIQFDLIVIEVDAPKGVFIENIEYSFELEK